MVAIAIFDTFAPNRAVGGSLALLAATAHTFDGAIWPQSYALAVSIAGLLWMASFIIYLIVYTPIFVGPRADGKPG